MKITILGNGNMASMLIKELSKSNNKIVVWGRNFAKVRKKFNQFNIDIIENIEDAVLNADIVFFAVKDEAIEILASKINKKNLALMIHTSGATSIQVLKKFNNRAVMWPPMSINSKTLQQHQFKVCIEANSPENLSKLEHIISLLGIEHLYITDSKHRLKMHLTATFLNNFTTYIHLEISKYCEKNKIPKEVYHEMMDQAKDSFFTGISNQLTGPASRGDQETLKRHLTILKNDNKLLPLYTFLSDQILNLKNYPFKIKDLE